jgi:monoterpene epsilon-lactone hydrolase
MVSRASRDFWQEGRKSPQFGAPGNEFTLDGLRQGMGVRQEPANRNVKCIRSQIEEMPCEWVVAPGADPDLRLLYLHGGGYVSGSGANYLPLAADISAAAQCAVLLPDYRLAPEHPFPEGLEDCIRAHEWMIACGPYRSAPARATFIAGDSAGGGLTLATLLALRDRHRPLPEGGIPMSCFADLTLASESIQSQSGNELYMHPSCLPQFVRLYVGTADVHDPLASPVFGDYTGIPPLLIQVGEYEVIRDDSIRVAAQARSAGVQVKLEVWPGQVHVFQIRGLPESRQAIDHIADFMRSCLAHIAGAGYGSLRYLSGKAPA